MPKVETQTKTEIIEELAFHETLMLDDGETELSLKFDKKVMDEILEDTELVIYSRQIRQNMDENDPEVLVQARRHANRAGRNSLLMDDIMTVLNQLRPLHEKAKAIATHQLMILYILDHDDKLFKLTERTGGAVSVTMLKPYDNYEIPDWYFKPKDTRSSMKRALIRGGQFTASEPLPNQQNSLDVMIGFTVGLLDANPEFALQAQKLSERATIALRYGGVELDDEQMDSFRSIVDELLFEPMDESNNNVNGTDSGTGISDSNESNGGDE